MKTKTYLVYDFYNKRYTIIPSYLLKIDPFSSPSQLKELKKIAKMYISDLKWVEAKKNY